MIDYNVVDLTLCIEGYALATFVHLAVAFAAQLYMVSLPHFDRRQCIGHRHAVTLRSVSVALQKEGEVAPDNLYRMSAQLIKVCFTTSKLRLVYAEAFMLRPTLSGTLWIKQLSTMLTLLTSRAIRSCS